MATTNDKNRGPEFLAVCCTGIAIAAVTVILRLWVRIKIVRKVGVDDWLAAISLVGRCPVLSYVRVWYRSSCRGQDTLAGGIGLLSSLSPLWCRQAHGNSRPKRLKDCTQARLGGILYCALSRRYCEVQYFGDVDCEIPFLLFHILLRSYHFH